jgi:hypothetical protein
MRLAKGYVFNVDEGGGLQIGILYDGEAVTLGRNSNEPFLRQEVGRSVLNYSPISELTNKSID